ncbi:heavy metal-associated isoprenylated plant protein 6 [Coffea eugenioides]|uniref:heavy metal-associated isoprenylated plant protein 6 n=1 Tax=Coffea eugenioides TaxID=49369 RepID=UPI000F604D04|nr:heavy metal-associated isoprenylated plant protein 6 [Coffea eugenioides]
MANLQIVPAGITNVVEAQYVEMKVPLYSYGCEKKVKKALAHLKGIYSIIVDYQEQKVTVWGICNKYDVLASIRNKRKGACFWKPEDSTQLLALEKLQTPPSSPQSDSCPNPKPTSASAPSLALVTKGLGRSLSWNTWKKVFIRSYSF